MKTFFIHDNGGRPFRVEIEGSNVRVLKKSKTDNPDDTEYSKEVATFVAKDVYIGKSSGKTKACDHTASQAKLFDGNSILLHIKDKTYVYIGHEIYGFQMLDDFDAYYSPVGNNDVPYPHVLGKTYVYFLLDKKYVERARFPPKQVWEEAFVPFMGTFDPKTGWVSEIGDAAKKLKTKLLHKRIW